MLDAMTFNAPINLIQMNRSIHLHYCFRKPNSYSVQLHDTKFYTSFKASKFPCLTAAHLLLCKWTTFLRDTGMLPQFN